MTMNVEKVCEQVTEFVTYVEGFYGNVPDAVYPIGATPKMILESTQKYIKSLNDKVTWGGGDSLDRERVRDIMIDDYGLEWK